MGTMMETIAFDCHRVDDWEGQSSSMDTSHTCSCGRWALDRPHPPDSYDGISIGTVHVRSWPSTADPASWHWVACRERNVACLSVSWWWSWCVVGCGVLFGVGSECWRKRCCPWIYELLGHTWIWGHRRVGCLVCCCWLCNSGMMRVVWNRWVRGGCRMMDRGAVPARLMMMRWNAVLLLRGCWMRIRIEGRRAFFFSCECQCSISLVVIVMRSWLSWNSHGVRGVSSHGVTSHVGWRWMGRGCGEMLGLDGRQIGACSKKISRYIEIHWNRIIFHLQAALIPAVLFICCYSRGL